MNCEVVKYRLLKSDCENIYKTKLTVLGVLHMSVAVTLCHSPGANFKSGLFFERWLL